MLRRATPAVLAVTALTLSACGGDAEADGGGPAALPSTSSPAATESSSPASRTNDAGVALNDRGNIPKEMGQEAGIGHPTDPDAPWPLTFTIDSVTVDQPCNTGFEDPPTNGHYIGIALRAATTADLPPDWYVMFDSYSFKVIGPDGLTISDVSGTAYSCLDSRSSFTSDPLAPGQQYAGIVVIDSPVTTGSLIYSADGDGTGWEWQF